jgi:hypothetical protein
MRRLVLGRAVTEQDVAAARAEHGWEAAFRHDPELDVSYLEVADGDVDAIRSSLEVPTLERLLTAFQIAPMAIARVGVAAPETLDPLVYEAFDEAFDHPEEDVRLTAVRAARYPGWPELRDRLERLADDDPDDGVRAAARAVLDAS